MVRLAGFAPSAPSSRRMRVAVRAAMITWRDQRVSHRADRTAGCELVFKQ